MTLIAIEMYTEEEKEAFYNSLTDEEKKECSICTDYNLDETWFKWEKICDRVPMNRYRLFKVDQLQGDHVIFVCFVDILKTAAALQDNYDDFRKVVGADFHPLELALNIAQKDCVLWERLRGHSHLWGILFGYGKMNASLFQMQYFDHPESCAAFCENIASFVGAAPVTEGFKSTIDSFEIPRFKSFNEVDPVVENYKKEREKIKEIYQGKDFLDVTLSKLTE